MPKNNGGPAYPTPADYYNGRTVPGMSLRDAFAIAALPVFLAAESTVLYDMTLDECFAKVAEGCYKAADAMLAEREK